MSLEKILVAENGSATGNAWHAASCARAPSRWPGSHVLCKISSAADGLVRLSGGDEFEGALRGAPVSVTATGAGTVRLQVDQVIPLGIAGRILAILDDLPSEPAQSGNG